MPNTARPRRVGRSWVWPDGTRLPVVAGGDGTEGDPKPTPDPAPKPQPDPPKPDPTPTALTQADVDRAAADAKKAAIADVVATFGCTIEEAKLLVDAKRQADDAQKTEAQKAREAADKEKAEAAEEKRTAAAERRALRVDRGLLTARVSDKRMEKAAKLILTELADDADEAAITAAVEAFKKDTPEWFGVAGAAPGSDPGGRGPGGGGQDGKTGMEAGRLRAQEEIKSRANAGSPFDGMTVVGRPPGGN